MDAGEEDGVFDLALVAFGGGAEGGGGIARGEGGWAVCPSGFFAHACLG